MDTRSLAVVENYRAKLDELRAERRAAGLALVGAGMSYRQAAEALGVSHATVLRDLGVPHGQLSARERGYDQKHRILRKQEARRVAAGGVPCARCGREIVPGQKWHLDHDDKDRSRYLGPSHERCNVAAGASRISPARTSSTSPARSSSAPRSTSTWAERGPDCIMCGQPVDQPVAAGRPNGPQHWGCV